MTSEPDPALRAALAAYDRDMRENVIPKIEADLKAQRRAAHFLRLGIPDPLASFGAGRAATVERVRRMGAAGLA